MRKLAIHLEYIIYDVCFYYVPGIVLVYIYDLISLYPSNGGSCHYNVYPKKGKPKQRQVE